MYWSAVVLPAALEFLKIQLLKYPKNENNSKSECSGKRGDQMPRGRKPLIALSEARHIAEKRGEARHFRHEPDMICTFVIYIIRLVAHVRVRRVERIRFTPEWLEREAAQDLATLRFIASSPEISRELWVYTPKGTFRFFRVLKNSLVELDRSGNPLPGQPLVPARTMPAAAPVLAEKSGGPGSATGSPGSAGEFRFASSLPAPLIPSSHRR